MTCLEFQTRNSYINLTVQKIFWCILFASWVSNIFGQSLFQNQETTIKTDTSGFFGGCPQTNFVSAWRKQAQSRRKNKKILFSHLPIHPHPLALRLVVNKSGMVLFSYTLNSVFSNKDMSYAKLFVAAYNLADHFLVQKRLTSTESSVQYIFYLILCNFFSVLCCSWTYPNFPLEGFFIWNPTPLKIQV